MSFYKRMIKMNNKIEMIYSDDDEIKELKSLHYDIKEFSEECERPVLIEFRKACGEFIRRFEHLKTILKRRKSEIARIDYTLKSIKNFLGFLESFILFLL